MRGDVVDIIAHAKFYDYRLRAVTPDFDALHRLSYWPYYRATLAVSDRLLSRGVK